MKKILVIGSLNMDQVTKVHHTPKVGETVVGNGLELIAGGKGANQAVAMGKLGADVTMIGMVGTDDFASQLLDNLKQMGVTDKVMKTDKAPTGTALIMVNESADHAAHRLPAAELALCATELTFRHPKTGKPMHFQVKPQKSVFQTF